MRKYHDAFFTPLFLQIFILDPFINYSLYLPLSFHFLFSLSSCFLFFLRYFSVVLYSMLFACCPFCDVLEFIN